MSVRMRRTLPLIVCTMLVTAITSPPAVAHLDKGRGYSHKHENEDCRTYTGSGSLGYADPITAILFGRGVDWVRDVKRLLERKAGWSAQIGDSVSAQNFWDHGGCERENVAAADRSNTQQRNRWHVRGRLQLAHPLGERFTVLTPHRDVWDTRCPGKFSFINGNHYVHQKTRNGSGFDRGREALKARLARYHLGYAKWGNTATMKQCNGQRAGANGYVSVLHVGR